MDHIIDLIIKFVSDGGQGVIVGILLGIIAHLYHERNEVIKEVKEKDEKIQKLIEENHKGTLAVTEALHGIRLVLAEIKGKIS